MATPIRYCFEGLGGLGYSVTAAATAADDDAAALAGAASCDGCAPRPHPTITKVARAISAPRLFIVLFMQSPGGPDKVRPHYSTTGGVREPGRPTRRRQ